MRLYGVTNHRHSLNFELSIHAILPLIRTIVWVISIVFLLDNLGFNITALIASLGVGGAAIALASQSILQDLFN